jgi:23S rRNA pseudouridine955/2504/2580 synthase
MVEQAMADARAEPAATVVVGDGKYGGADAFLTGGISRKLHLHARRLKIDALGGGKVDVTAELPEHFAQSLETLGFEIASAKPPPRPTPRPKAGPGTKPRRTNRRGERRARTGRGRR